jgi:hypothetical protein
MDYVKSYGLKLNGRIVSGKLTGREYAGQHHDLVVQRTVEAAVSYANEYGDVFRGTVEVYSRQWFDQKPEDIGANQEWKPSPARKGGFLFTYGLHTVTF